MKFVSSLPVFLLAMMPLLAAVGANYADCSWVQTYCGPCAPYFWEPRAVTLGVQLGDSDLLCSGVGFCRPRGPCKCNWLWCDDPCYGRGCSAGDPRVTRDAAFGTDAHITDWQQPQRFFHNLFYADVGNRDDHSCLNEAFLVGTSGGGKKLYSRVEIPAGNSVIIPARWRRETWFGVDGTYHTIKYIQPVICVE